MNTDYTTVAKAIEFIRANHQSQPGLDEVAEVVSLSPYHLQRLFRRWAGISPKRFLQYLTVDHAKSLLRHSRSLLDATLEVGLSSPGRLHDHFVHLDGVSPGEYKALGQGLAIGYGQGETPFGQSVVAFSQRGICHLSFSDGTDGEIAHLKEQWKNASWHHEPERAQEILDQIFTQGEGDLPQFNLSVTGTNFQIQVWKALLQVPSGLVWSYQQIAEIIGKPTAARAVANAVGANPVAYLIPCHRVIRGEGQLGGYRWSPVRKQAILGWEAAHADLGSDWQSSQVALPGL